MGLKYRYKVIDGKNLKRLSQKVRNCLNDGWTCTGGVAVDSELITRTKIYLQAMTKEESK